MANAVCITTFEEAQPRERRNMGWSFPGSLFLSSNGVVDWAQTDSGGKQLVDAFSGFTTGFEFPGLHLNVSITSMEQVRHRENGKVRWE